MTAVKPTEKIGRAVEGGEWETRDKSHTKCRLPPKQLVCNQRHSSLLSGQFDFHLSNEALIFGLITAPANWNWQLDNLQIIVNYAGDYVNSPFFHFSWAPTLSPVEDEKGGNKGGRKKKGLILVTIREGWEGRKGAKNEEEGREKGVQVGKK